MGRLLGITGLGRLQFPLSAHRRIRRGEKKGGVRGLFFLCAIVLLLSGTVALSEAFKLPDTGQTKCYQAVDPYTEISCAGTGQDGAYSINPMSYTDNSNGTVTDNNTGLMWQKGENPSTYNWYQATGTYDATYNPSSQSVCGSLNLGGHPDWRLPSKKELITLVDYSIGYPDPGPTINTSYFPNTYASDYWSSTPAAPFPNNAWVVHFSRGHVSEATNKNVGLDVRCVRGGQGTPSLTDNGNGTVTDNKTGLVWQQGEPGGMSWGSALSYCEGLTLGGDSGWRLPNVKELESLTDDSIFYPVIDTAYFPNTYVYEYWSSTTFQGNPKFAWDVNFGYGYVSYYEDDKAGDMYVRCVRGGQSDNCASTLSSSDLSIHVPILDFAGYHYWADFMYVPDLDFTLVNVGEVSDLAPYNSCTHATLSGTTLGLHIPNLLFGGASYWADFAYKEGLTFTVVNLGGN